MERQYDFVQSDKVAVDIIKQFAIRNDIEMKSELGEALLRGIDALKWRNKNDNVSSNFDNCDWSKFV